MLTLYCVRIKVNDINLASKSFLKNNNCLRKNTHTQRVGSCNNLQVVYTNTLLISCHNRKIRHTFI